jgi:hypothetical protein
MNKRFFLPVLAVLLCAGTAFPQDYGLTLRSLPVLFQGEPEAQFEYTGTAAPWFAVPLGEQGDLYLSGGISAVYSDEEWRPAPEPYRFAIAWRFSSGLRLEAGRFPYRDPFNLAMNGLFDGLALDIDLGKTRFAGGAFYTGLLYKKTAHIVMSPGDYAAYYDRDSYFASRRLVFSLGWEIPALFDADAKLNVDLIGQFDVNDPDESPDESVDQLDGEARLHSQYALAGFTLPFFNYFNAELGVLAGMIEEGEGVPGFCFAASANLVALPPGRMNDRLSLGMALSSGVRDGTVKAFRPINTIAQGKALRPNLSGLALVEVEYVARLHNSLSAELSGAYFFRTDSHTYSDPEIDAASLSPLLGGEVYGGLNWAPVSDIVFTLGGGAFFPRSGKAFVTDAAPRWRVSLETILSF